MGTLGYKSIIGLFVEEPDPANPGQVRRPIITGGAGDPVLYVWNAATSASLGSIAVGTYGRPAETVFAGVDEFKVSLTNDISTAQRVVSYERMAQGNSTDDVLLARANHTGTQPASTISDFNEAVDDRVAALIVDSPTVTKSYDDVTGKITLTAVASGSAGLDTEAVDDRVAALIYEGTNITKSYDDAAGRLTLSTTATVNSTDAVLKARANHTGTQLASTISDFNTAVVAAASEAAGAGTVPKRTANGQLFASDPTADGHVATRGWTQDEITTAVSGLGSGGITAVTLDNVPTGFLFTRYCVGGVWQGRGSTRSDITCMWVQLAASDPVAPTTSGYALARDLFFKMS